MGFPYEAVFGALLVAYMVVSEWERLDSRYPIVAGLVLLVVAAVADAAGGTATANTLAVYVFFLLGAGVVLLLVDYVRDSRKASAARGPTANEEPASAGPGSPGAPRP